MILLAESVVEEKREFRLGMAKKLGDDVSTVIILYCDIDSVLILAKLLLKVPFTNLQWKEIMLSHDPCFASLLKLGYQSDYHTEFQTRFLEESTSSIISASSQFRTPTLKDIFAVSLHLSFNEDKSFYACDFLQGAHHTFSMGQMCIKESIYDIDCNLWLNHLPSGQKVKFSLKKHNIFVTGFELHLRTKNGFECEVNILNHLLNYSEFRLQNLDVVFLKKNGNHIYRNFGEILASYEYL